MVAFMSERTASPPHQSDDMRDGASAAAEESADRARRLKPPLEVGGPEGPEPTRYGDWQVKGRVSDF